MFEGVVEYLKLYRQRRANALENNEQQQWFTSESDTMRQLVDETFGSEDENAKLEQLMRSKTPVAFERLESARIKIAFIAGFRHDIRAQFAVGDMNEEKTQIDFMRHNAGHLTYERLRTDAVARHLSRKDNA
jgi:hypothetical protein